MYLRWRRLLPRWVEIVPVELPGRGSRMGERFAEDFGELVAVLCEEQSHALRGQYALFGHSMGALLAWGVAARLNALGRPLPQALFVSGSPAPSKRDRDRFANKDDDAALIVDLRKQGGTPDEVFASAELMRLTLDVLGADYRVCKSFRHAGGEALPLPVHALGGREDNIDPERIEAWSVETDVAFTLDWFDGGHFFIRQQEPQVLTVVQQRLAQALTGGAHAAVDFA